MALFSNGGNYNGQVEGVQRESSTFYNPNWRSTKFPESPEDPRQLEFDFENGHQISIVTKTRMEETMKRIRGIREDAEYYDSLREARA